MQDAGWCNVGRLGKHKHEPDERLLARSNGGRRRSPWHSSAVGQHVKQDSPKEDPSLGLTSLPGTALVLIFHRLDCASALSLAQTCSTFAAEYVQQKSEFDAKCMLELTPKVRTKVHDMEWSGRFLSIDLWWEGTMGHSSNAIRRIYQLASQPYFLERLWKAVLVPTFWAQVQAQCLMHTEDANGQLGHHLEDDAHHCDLQPCVNILLDSNKYLWVPWHWLSEAFLTTFAVAFECGWQACGAVKPLHRLECSLYRPAEAGLFQNIMTLLFYDTCDSHTLQGFAYCDSDESVMRYSDDYGIPSGYMVLPDHEQRVTVTGSWCRRLPESKWSLLGAHWGVIPHGRVHGDRFLGPCVKPDHDALYSDESDFQLLLYEYALAEAMQRLKPYTCEVDRHPCWYYY
ncbi:hypothetical protein ABBQ38_010395 [Trebouxia sp. C0009 RCD-2024]